MSLLSFLGIQDAFAAAAPAANAPHGGLMSMLPFFLIFLVAVYFLMIRPQSKRAKQQRELMSSISIGDEVATIGGIVGRVRRLDDDLVILELSEGVEITMQKRAISTVLPKGTMDKK